MSQILVLLICATCCLLCVFFVITTRLTDDNTYSRAFGNIDLSKLSERSALPILAQIQRRFLYKELDPNQKAIEGQQSQQQINTALKATQTSAKNKYSEIESEKSTNNNKYNNIDNNLKNRLKINELSQIDDDFSDLLHFIDLQSTSAEESSRPQYPLLAEVLEHILCTLIKDTDNTWAKTQKDGGTQLKLVIDYENGGQALFKPMSID
ncbi:unnamed protein product [Medioppia subpectinata]|uniref:Uncharacterized protein n=1 Tax=Medioppia subpectinata TaxID=1979941 RepID=A0A7R9PYI1_9ACAR|nr:unnamed protein product [Medioppia subpectinata]CAG2105918.1 unnamed protein product [Medioppia subpectinata]